MNEIPNVPIHVVMMISKPTPISSPGTIAIKFKPKY